MTREQEELIQLENDWCDAIRQHDRTKLATILADDYTNTDAEGTVWTKETDLANFVPGRYVVTSLTLQGLEPRVYGNAAVVTGRDEVKAKFKDVDVSGSYRWTDTWVKDKSGSWRCVASHGSRIAYTSEL
jgi:ketosteroid isomerase-like protein